MIKKCTECGKEYEATGKINTMFTQDFPCDECCAKIVAERKKKYCEHCGMDLISDDPDIAEEGLCDRCADEINNEEIIGYRKGE